MALLVNEKFYSIGSEREGVDWDPLSNCNLTHLFSQNTKWLKGIVSLQRANGTVMFFPKEN